MNSWGYRVIFSTLLVAPLLLPACGGKDDGASASTAPPMSVDSGIDGDKPLSELSDGEIAAIGQAAADYAKSELAEVPKQQLCTFAGGMAAGMSYAMGSETTDAGLQALCASTADSCMQSTPSSSSSSSTSSTSSGSSDNSALRQCTATVGEYEDCQTAITDLLVGTIETLPGCSSVTSADFDPKNAVNLATLAGCEVLAQKCPELTGTEQ